MNIYLIESTDIIVINKMINDILKKNNLDSNNIIRHNMQEVSIGAVTHELDTYNFLMDKKIIICDDCFFMSPTRVKSAIEHDLKALKKYIENPNKDNYLIMICDRLSDKKEIKELITSNVTRMNANVNINDLIKDNLEDFSMSSVTINFLINYCLNDNEKILTELEKLKAYKYDEKVITTEDITAIVIKDYDEDVFDLVNAVIKRNKNLAYEIYKRIMIKEKDTTLIVASISSNIRNMYSSKILMKDGMSVDNIALSLGVKPRAVTIALDNARMFSEKTLLSFLEKLADLDIKSKTGYGDSETLFEIFLLNL